MFFIVFEIFVVTLWLVHSVVCFCLVVNCYVTAQHDLAAFAKQSANMVPISAEVRFNAEKVESLLKLL